MTSPQPIAPYLTMRIGGTVTSVTPLKTRESLAQFYTETHATGTPFFILGHGSNAIFSDTHHNLAVGKIEIDGISTLRETSDTVTYKVGAGVSWDSFVAFSVMHNLQGIEALTAIPGTVGATPIQNVGAYGTDIQAVLDEVEVFDTHTREYTSIPKSACNFEYRDSLFKHEKNRFLVHHIILTLRKHPYMSPAPIPQYAGVKEYLETLHIEKPTLMDIRHAIKTIRSRKLPDPTIIHNSGSFFKNPRLEKQQAKLLLENFPDAPHFIEPDGLYKIPAGWLVERAGFKGYPGNIGTYEHNALVIVNRGGNFHELTALVSNIQHAVKKKFDINLEIEPEIIT